MKFMQPVIAVFILCILLIGCSTPNPTRDYQLTRLTYITTVATIRILERNNTISPTTLEEFESIRSQLHPLLDEWGNALVENRPFNTQLIFDLLDRLLLIEDIAQQEPTHETHN